MRLSDVVPAGGLFTAQTTVGEVLGDPDLKAIAPWLFPRQLPVPPDLPLAELGAILPWYNRVSTERTLEVLQALKERSRAGDPLLYRIYEPQESAADPDLAGVALIHFRGRPGARTALVVAGGGFVYVGALHDSFPQALALSRRGYHACALLYRPPWDPAVRDVARAIAWLHAHERELKLSMAGYALWGGSAGGRIVTAVGALGTAACGAAACPPPAAVITMYSGYDRVHGTEPPSLEITGEEDEIAPPELARERQARLLARGRQAELVIHPGLPHGFGLGTGTDHLRIMDTAVDFWTRMVAEGGHD